MKQEIKCLKKCQTYIIVSIVTLLITCISVCFTGIVARIAQETQNNIPLYLVGGAFWLGLLLTYVCTAIASLYRKRGMSAQKDGLASNKKIGLFSFFSHQEAKIIDIVMFLSIAILVAGIALGINNSIYVLGSIVLTLFSLHLHAILNGRNYQYIKENHHKRKMIKK